MATKHKTRIRQVPVLGGVHYGIRAAGRYYNVHPSVVSSWIRSGEVGLAGPSEPGDPLPIADASLRRRLASYSPDRDNKSRRSRTIPRCKQNRLAAERLAFQATGIPLIMWRRWRDG